ncbi:hypothetical protein [Lentiprolixibacter aurantiacus]|uniref:Lipoprotein n=1 Tax=Lentiprolixibacter aurantiacus TaxID=2993939 RepID=A0AAE3MME0_9FLAO|nr:hypothetical protein [Lentiprolixibacter aurantiacus]MCX2720036.1 hypothetical protein [Lentiprolixibacter aurantiacus]
MKKTFLLFLFVMLNACGDGELEIDVIDFDSASLQFCETQATVNSTIFFKINDDEALILELQSGLLQNQASTDTIRSSFPSQSSLIYRLFTEGVNKSYFCDDIPPATPSVREEILAEAGEVLITTIQSATDTTLYEHTIKLGGVTLVNSRGERITNTQIEDFGTITTQE